MLERKGLDYRRVDLIPMVAKPVLRALRFPSAMSVDGRRVQGSRAVREAERFGDEVLQPIARRAVWWALRRDSSSLASFAEGARLGVPVGIAVKTAPPIIWAAARHNRSSDEAVRADLAALPGRLDRVDGWIEEGVLGGEQPNARRLPDRDQRAAARVHGGPAAGDRATPGGRAGTAGGAGVPGRGRPRFPQEWLAGLRRGSAD